jgi:hypothetical protein
LVRVRAVEAARAIGSIGFAESEFVNLFGKALYERFNGETNSAIVTSSDGSTKRVYGYDPKTLSVRVASDGVSFWFQFKVDQNNFCDPTVHASGAFKLLADTEGIRVKWVSPPVGTLHFPVACQILEGIPILGAIPAILVPVIDGRVGTSVRTSIEDAVTKSFPTDTDIRLFFRGTTTEKDQLLVHLELPMPSIDLHIPYDAFDMDRTGTMLPRGETVAVLASGLGVQGPAADATPPQNVRSGPNGVPRIGMTTWPNAHTLRRGASLVWRDVPVARLLARTVPAPLESIHMYQYTPGCALRPPSRLGSPPTVRFGVNDTIADAQRLRGILLAAPGYDVRVYFLNALSDETARTATLCKSDDPPDHVLR